MGLCSLMDCTGVYRGMQSQHLHSGAVVARSWDYNGGGTFTCSIRSGLTYGVANLGHGFDSVGSSPLLN